MSSRHPYNAVFPVVLVSSAVFSILSLPFFLYHLQPEANSSNLHQDFRPVLESNNRDLTIRYIGAAMVISVISGISTIELQRKCFTRRSAVVPLAGQDQNRTEISDQPLVQPFSDSFTFDAEFDVEPVESTEPILPADLERSSLLSRANSVDSVPPPAGQELIAELNQNYATCRIWVQPLHRRLFAIQVEGQFYSFFRLLPTQESARQIALQLSENLNRTVITPVEQEFAVWVWQPEAELEAQPA